MNEEPIAPQSSSAEHTTHESQRKAQIGLYDIVEAFTALRQQWRTGAKENRDLAEAIQATAEHVSELQKRFGDTTSRLESLVESARPDDTILPLVKCLAEIDRLVRRAVESLERADGSNEQPVIGHSGTRAEKTAAKGLSFEASTLAAECDWIEQKLGELPLWRRLICRPFAMAIISHLDMSSKNLNLSPATSEPSPEMVGLKMLLDRIDGMLNENRIQRLETLGKPFDGQFMVAIDVVSAEMKDPSMQGCVVHQHSPAYRWKDKIIRFAEVQVAR